MKHKPKLFVIKSDAGWWDNLQGWVDDIGLATKFYAHEKGSVSLPVGTNVVWIRYKE
jgi:hypothetical protein